MRENLTPPPAESMESGKDAELELKHGGKIAGGRRSILLEADSSGPKARVESE